MKHFFVENNLTQNFLNLKANKNPEASNWASG